VVSEEDADAQWALMAHNGGHRTETAELNLGAGRSGGYHQRAGRLRELRPTADVVELPGVGHYPQVEVPDVFTRAALSLLSASTR
jgi:pimeloyl-ACP methyl ester carboxylesterase